MKQPKQEVNRRWPVLFLAVLGVLGLQSMRVLLPTFVYYLRDARGMSSLTLAPIALGTFALGLIAWPLYRLLGVRRGLVVAVCGLAVFRLVEQATYIPALDLYLSAAALVFYLISLPLAYGWLHHTRRSPGAEFGLGVFFAFFLDSTIHMAGWTLDLSWHRGWAPFAVVVLLSSGLLLSLWRTIGGQWEEEIGEGDWGAVLPLAALGPYTFLHLLVYQNIARTASYAGWPLPAAGAWTAFINSCALGALVWVSTRGGLSFRPRLAAAIGLLATTLAPSLPGLLPVILSGAGLILSVLLVQTIFLRLRSSGSKPGLRRICLTFLIGFQLFAVSALLYYIVLDLDLGFRSPVLLPAAAGVIAWASLSGRLTLETSRPVGFNVAVFAAGLLFFLVPIGLLISSRQPETLPAPAEPADLRVMTYNLHQGFNTSGLLDIEALALVIEAQDPDVVALQEVSRGYLISGSLDMVSWLSRRLNMAAEFGPTADPQWGNAVLSRYTLDQVRNVPLPPDSLQLRRGYLDVRFQFGGQELRLLATHLHHLGPDSEIRQIQVQALLEGWGNSPRTVLLGDLNAEPDSPEMLALEEAGWQDAALSIGQPAQPTYPSTGPDGKIDYIWISEGLSALGASTVSSLASDHLPVIATLKIDRP